MNETEFNKLVKEWEDALDMSFGDFCQDTGCFPDCFQIKGKRLNADFEVGNFVRQAVVFFLSNRNEVVAPDPTSTNRAKSKICPKCKGEGEIWDSKRCGVDTCALCGGEGKL